MRWTPVAFVSISLLLSLGYTNCSGELHVSSLVKSRKLASSSPLASNVTTVTLTGDPYFNAPTVTVTLCTPGTNTCVDIPNVLLDTGSHGLRVFASLMTAIVPSAIQVSGKQLAECYQYYDGTYGDWGPVKSIDVRIGTETASSVPVQMIDAGYSGIPATCRGADTDPQQLGFNGILGVGVMGADCGTSCVTQTSLNMYYACAGTTCTATTVPLASQVTNPVSKMAIDNNGLIVQFPSIAVGGAAAVTGQLILGIGTQTNNAATGLTVLPTDQYGYFKASLNGTSYDAQAFDSGTSTNSLATAIGMTKCTQAQLTDYLCPATSQTVTVANMGFSGSASKSDRIEVANAQTLINSGNANFNNISDVNTIGVILWGTPYFFGRTIYIGLEGKTTKLGQGPFWAY